MTVARLTIYCALLMVVSFFLWVQITAGVHVDTGEFVPTSEPPIGKDFHASSHKLNTKTENQ